MKAILKKTLSSPRWKHCVSAIPKGTIVEYSTETNGSIIVRHNNQSVSILIPKDEIKKYFNL